LGEIARRDTSNFAAETNLDHITELNVTNPLVRI
jgi:hypothetical protein